MGMGPPLPMPPHFAMRMPPPAFFPPGPRFRFSGPHPGYGPIPFAGPGAAPAPHMPHPGQEEAPPGETAMPGEGPPKDVQKQQQQQQCSPFPPSMMPPPFRYFNIIKTKTCELPFLKMCCTLELFLSFGSMTLLYIFILVVSLKLHLKNRHCSIICT